MYILFSAPSATPRVNISEVTTSTITVQWGAVDCIHRNGDITGYTVRYGVQGNGSIQTVTVSGGGSSQTIISGLTPSTNYSIEVAAVNSAGTGLYSDAVFLLTRGIHSGNIVVCNCTIYYMHPSFHIVYFQLKFQSCRLH